MRIEVRCDQTGDRAEAPDEHSALVAARTLLEDAMAGPLAHYNFRPTATFFVAGEPVLGGIAPRDLWRALGAARR